MGPVPRSKSSSIVRRDQWWLADRAFESELGTVVRQHRIEVIEAALGQRLDRLQDFDGTSRARQLGALADVDES